MIAIHPPADPGCLYSTHTFACQISGDGPNFYLSTTCVLLGLAPSPLIAWALLNAEYATWLEVVGFLLALVIWLPGFFGGLWLADWLETRIRKLLGIELFSAANARVTVDSQGLSIEGLGLSPWADIEHWQEHSDSGNYALITTRQFGQIMLREEPERIFAILAAGKQAAAE